ncbi:MAG: hypothetical protein KF842_06610 [Caulobacter sp.]|nr:hypothetical protein [Caulobacter sp.]
MDRSRRAMIVTLAAGGLLATAAPVLAAEVDAVDPVGETPGWSGVELARDGAAWRIVMLEPLGPAARAGLRPGDLVAGWSGGSLEALSPSLAGPAGDRFDLTTIRAGVPRPVCIILEQPDPEVRP